jgi:DNA recombination protein RmuC
MNLETIIILISVSLISLSLGCAITLRLVPKIFSSTFKTAAKEAFTETTSESKLTQDLNEQDIAKKLVELDKSLLEAKTVWSTNTSNITESFDQLSSNYIRWEEALSNTGEQGALAEEALKVMLETAGLVKGVNFDTQITETLIDGVLRPDFYVYTPDQGVIIIDSKAPIKKYKEAINADNEIEKQQKLRENANNMLAHAVSLGQTDYTDHIGRSTPDVVIMYVPNIAIYLSAIEQIPDLVQRAWQHKVNIAPPEAVYPILKNIMLTWQQKKLYENAEDIQKQTKEIHKRAKKFQEYFSKIGKGLTMATKDFNRGVSSWESRLTPAFRKLEEMGIAEDLGRQMQETQLIEESIYGFNQESQDSNEQAEQSNDGNT